MPGRSRRDRAERLSTGAAPATAPIGEGRGIEEWQFVVTALVGPAGIALGWWLNERSSEDRWDREGLRLREDRIRADLMERLEQTLRWTDLSLRAALYRSNGDPDRADHLGHEMEELMRPDLLLLGDEHAIGEWLRVATAPRITQDDYALVAATIRNAIKGQEQLALGDKPIRQLEPSAFPEVELAVDALRSPSTVERPAP